MIVGIDPGAKGGIAWIGPEDGKINAQVMQELPDVISIMEKLKPSVVYLEKAQAMPKQGVVSMFNYGVHFGCLIGVLRALRIPIRLVRPSEWAKEMHRGSLAGKAKQRSKEVALNLFPHKTGLQDSKRNRTTAG